MDKILKQNPGWIIMERLARNLGEYSSAKEENLTPSEMAYLKLSLKVFI